MNRYIKTIEATDEQIAHLEELGFVVRWLAHLDYQKELIEVYAKGE